ncbi:MAG: mechanosensitive ion channel family protein [Coprobacillus sp.]|nr:mechanosensitive ion channel family protein [Coprobacillus sp.]
MQNFDFLDYFINKGQPILDSIITFIIGWYLAKLLLYILIKMLKKSTMDPIVISFIKSILSVSLKVLVIVTCIAQLGVNISSLVTVLATAGAAIVLGLKDSMSGVVSGIVILMTKPFVKGDIIEVNGYIGKIEEIQMLYTFLITFDNKMVVIPNNELSSSTFVNYSHEDMRRIDMNFDIHYDSDVEKAKAIILDVISKHPLTLEEPEAYARVSQYKDNAISIALRVWVKTDDYYILKDDLMEQIKREFDNNGIDIPYQQIDIHVHNQKE